MKQVRLKDRDLIESKSKLPYDGFVYFVGSFNYSFVKIGYSKDPIARMSQLQTGCPFKLKMFFVINGNESTEKKLHHKFKVFNTYGEWFKVKGLLRDYIISTMKLKQDPSIQSANNKKPKSVDKDLFALDREFNQMFSKW